MVVTKTDDSQIVISLNTHRWRMGDKINYNITITPYGSITIVPGDLLLPYTGVNHLTDNIEVMCEDANGNNAPDMEWTLDVGESGPDLFVPWDGVYLSENDTSPTESLSGRGSATVYTYATENPDASARYKTICLNGKTDIICNVTQAGAINIGDIIGGGTAIDPSRSYVGAFWRANQTGERLIRIPVGATNNGDWIATVIFDSNNGFADNDILLDVPANAFTYPVSGDAESNPVTGSQTTVGGSAPVNGYIYFRIGLNRNNTPFVPTEAKPARYAVVAISYKNYKNTQLLYLRQGEAADYVGATLDKWSVYNSQPTSYSYTGTQTPIIPVSYPTQAGGFKQFNSATGFFTPTERIPSTIWDMSDSSPTIGTDADICPSEYKVPTGGSGKTMQIGSLLTGTSSVWGYYADGYFDRGLVNSSTTVGSGNDVAYLGRLFAIPTLKPLSSYPLPGASESAMVNCTALAVAATTGQARRTAAAVGTGSSTSALRTRAASVGAAALASVVFALFLVSTKVARLNRLTFNIRATICDKPRAIKLV